MGNHGTPYNPADIPLTHADYHPSLPTQTLLSPCNKLVDAVYGNWTCDAALTKSADTTRYVCGDGTTFASIKLTPNGAAAQGYGRLTFPAPVDLSNKCLGLWLYLDPGNTDDGADNDHVAAVDTTSWLKMFKPSSSYSGIEVYIYDAGGGYNRYMIGVLNGGLYGAKPGWNLLTFDVENPTVAAALTTNAATYMNVVVWGYDYTNPYAWILNIGKIATWARPAQGYFMPVCEAAYAGAYKIAAILANSGLRGSFALDPAKLQLGTDGDATYLTWAKALQMRNMGHFIYMYPGHSGYAAANVGWNARPHTEKVAAIHFCRNELSARGLLDAQGRAAMACPSASWSGWDDNNLLGKEVLYLPTNVGFGGYAHRTMMDVWGQVGFSATIADTDAGAAARAAATATLKSLNIELYHGDSDANISLFAAQLARMIANGSMTITVGDLMAGRI